MSSDPVYDLCNKFTRWLQNTAMWCADLSVRHPGLKDSRPMLRPSGRLHVLLWFLVCESKNDLKGVRFVKAINHDVRRFHNSETILRCNDCKTREKRHLSRRFRTRRASKASRQMPWHNIVPRSWRLVARDGALACRTQNWFDCSMHTILAHGLARQDASNARAPLCAWISPPSGRGIRILRSKNSRISR